MCKPMVEFDSSPVIHSETVREVQEDVRDSGSGGKAGRQSDEAGLRQVVVVTPQELREGLGRGPKRLEDGGTVQGKWRYRPTLRRPCSVEGRPASQPRYPIILRSSDADDAATLGARLRKSQTDVPLLNQ